MKIYSSYLDRIQTLHTYLLIDNKLITLHNGKRVEFDLMPRKEVVNLYTDVFEK